MTSILLYRAHLKLHHWMRKMRLLKDKPQVLYKILFYSTAFKCWTITAVDIDLTEAVERCQRLKAQGVKCYILQEEKQLRGTDTYGTIETLPPRQHANL